MKKRKVLKIISTIAISLVVLSMLVMLVAPIFYF